jgi:hypothetical protein
MLKEQSLELGENHLQSILSEIKNSYCIVLSDIFNIIQQISPTLNND